MNEGKRESRSVWKGEADPKTPSGGTRPQPMLQGFLDITLPVSVVLGRTRRNLSEVLKTTSGSVFPLDRKVGDLVDIVIDDFVFARGEVVLVNGNYAVKIKQLRDGSDQVEHFKQMLDPAAARY